MWKEARSVEERLGMLKEARDFEDSLEGFTEGWRGSLETGGLKGAEGAEQRLDRKKEQKRGWTGKGS
jgi:hypothetical protein